MKPGIEPGITLAGKFPLYFLSYAEVLEEKQRMRFESHRCL